MTCRETILEVLRLEKRVTSIDMQARAGVQRRSVTTALRRMRDAGEIVLVGKGPQSLWCHPEIAAEALREIEAKSAQIKAAQRQRSIAAKRAKRDSWGESEPVQRIVSASLAKAPRVKVRSVWDLAA